MRRREIELYEKDLTRALSERSHVTAFDTRTYFYRIDFKGVYTPLDKETMATKQHVTLLDNLAAWLTCPEMQIIAKLLPGMRSETDLLDIKNILLTLQDELDREILFQLARKFNVEQELTALFRRSVD
ncbi:MAG: hypothetical protein ACTSYG_03140 [Candidatus Heimdallarchaeota archaeon]